MTVEDIMEIFKPWIYNDENQAGTQLEVVDASDPPMIADKIVKYCNVEDIGSAFYCQRDIEGESVCDNQCEHC